MQVMAGATPVAAMANVLGTFLFGVWLGVLVLCVDALWPAIFLHTVSNACILIKGLSSVWVDPVSTGYLINTLFDIPLIFLAFGYMLKVPSVRWLAHQSAPGINPGV
jgi:hypothetical protein